MTPSATAIPKSFTAPDTSRAMFWWLVVVSLFVCAMILVGGATRLTDSGLAITEWRPVTGAMPPLTAEGWEAELQKYRLIPEYQQQNRGMSMAEFQFIYWWEWGHRQLGRTLGLVYFLPFVFFLAKGIAPKRLRPRLWVLFALGGLQGAIGWWMVSSGLAERLDVSQYRLATHLTMAFVILGLSLWTALELRYGETRVSSRTRFFSWASAFWAAVLLQVALGAFVAGLDAGRIHTSWPGFNGRLIPEDYLMGMPFLQAIFESRPAVQFQHRWFAYALAVAGGVLAWAYHRSGDKMMRNFALVLPTVLFAQIVLGIATLVSAAPLSLSLLHQGGAIALFLTAGAAAWTAARALPAVADDQLSAVATEAATTSRATTSRATILTRESPRS